MVEDKQTKWDILKMWLGVHEPTKIEDLSMNYNHGP